MTRKPKKSKPFGGTRISSPIFTQKVEPLYAGSLSTLSGIDSLEEEERERGEGRVEVERERGEEGVGIA